MHKKVIKNIIFLTHNIHYIYINRKFSYYFVYIYLCGTQIESWHLDVKYYCDLNRARLLIHISFIQYVVNWITHKKMHFETMFNCSALIFDFTYRSVNLSLTMAIISLFTHISKALLVFAVAFCTVNVFDTYVGTGIMSRFANWSLMTLAFDLLSWVTWPKWEVIFSLVCFN